MPNKRKFHAWKSPLLCIFVELNRSSGISRMPTFTIWCAQERLHCLSPLYMKNFAIIEKNYIYHDIFVIYSGGRHCGRKLPMANGSRSFCRVCKRKRMSLSVFDVDLGVRIRAVGGMKVGRNNAPHAAATIIVAGECLDA
jgi:hypothetical protein